LRRDGPVGGISLNCPEKRNVPDRASLAALEEHLDGALSFEGARS
jgi:hypothetical protein